MCCLLRFAFKTFELLVSVGTLGAGAVLPKESEKEDIFGFVGAEMSKANKQ